METHFNVLLVNVDSLHLTTPSPDLLPNWHKRKSKEESKGSTELGDERGEWVEKDFFLSPCSVRRAPEYDPAWYQSSTRIPDPWNSRENQLDFFSLNHEISRSLLEKWDWKRKFSFSSHIMRLKERISRSRLEISQLKKRYHFQKNEKINIHCIGNISPVTTNKSYSW